MPTGFCLPRCSSIGRAFVSAGSRGRVTSTGRPLPMLSRSVKPAGEVCRTGAVSAGHGRPNRLGPCARGGGEAFPGRSAHGCVRAKGASPLGTPRCLPSGYTAWRRWLAASGGINRAAQAGTSAAIVGPGGPGPADLPTPVVVAPTPGCGARAQDG
jgi:hypothetical protein